MNPLLLPAVLAQGIRVRRTTERLPEPLGPAHGKVGSEGSGGATSVRVAVLGESTAAGCGVDEHRDGFGGSLGRELHQRWGRAVDWEAIGRYGVTIGEIRAELLPELVGNVRVAVLLAGVNDVLRRTRAADWADGLAAVAGELADRAEQVVVTGIPSFTLFPSLPPLLGRYLSERADVLDERSRAVCAGLPRVTWTSANDALEPDPAFFARDGFHPSAYGYAEWARHVAALVTGADAGSGAQDRTAGEGAGVLPEG